MIFKTLRMLIKVKTMSSLGLLHIIKSVLAAGIGVQSNKNRKTDFEHGSLPNYLIVGFIVTILFIIALISIVSIVTH
jgi:uncharacterized membrane protein